MTLVPYILAGVIIANFMLSIMILSRGMRDRINEIFGLLSFSVVLWSVGILGFYFIELPDFLSSHWIILTHSSAILIAISFFYFSLNFPNKLTKNRLLYFLYSVPFFVMLYCLFFTQRIIGNVIGNSYEINSCYIVYGLFVALYFFGGYINLFIQHQKTNEWAQKMQVRYVLIGSILSSIPATVTDLIFPYIGIFKYTWLGPLFTLVLVLSIAMAIFRYRLFNIKVIATELLTFTIWIFVLVRMLLANNLQDRLINAGLLLFLVISGILLIRSVLKEVHSREKIEQLAKELERANIRLTELDQAKSDFVTITSHQLRAPITAVKGYASMIIEGTYGEVPEKLKQPLDRIFQSSDRLVRLIGDFLNLSRIERGKMEYDFQKFDLKELVKNIYEDFSQINRKRRVPLDFSLNLDENEKFIVVADQEKIRQAMSNITDNALKYTKKGFVKISLYKDDLRERIIFKIQDSGMGIDKEGLARIFQKFTRARNGSLSVHVEGTGLGLYVAKEILKEHEGDIRAESRGIGKGSAFYIELPMKFITPAEKEKMEKEQRQRQENVEGFVKGI